MRGKNGSSNRMFLVALMSFDFGCSTLASSPNMPSSTSETRIHCASMIPGAAAIGQLGALAEDKELLTRLEKSGQRLAYAAKPALQKLADSNTP